MSPRQGHDLESTTLELLNELVFEANAPGGARWFRAITGVSLPNLDIRLIEFLNGRLPTTTADIAVSLMIDLPQTSRRIGKLESLGYVQRRQDPEDGRRSMSELTPAGRSLADQWMIAWAEQLVEAIDPWQQEDCRALNEWLGCVMGVLQRAYPDLAGPTAPGRWDAIAPRSLVTGDKRRMIVNTISLMQYTSHSRTFEQLLVRSNAPVTEAVFATLHEVVRRGPIAVTAIAERTDVDHTQASKRVRSLADLQMVERTNDPLDRRRTLVAATAHGASLHAQISAIQLNDFVSAVGDVSSEDRAQWSRLMIALAHGLGAIEAEMNRRS